MSQDEPSRTGPFAGEVSILGVGRTFRPEFREARAALEGWGRVVAAIDVEAAGAQLAGGEVAPDLIVVAQAYPGELGPDEIDRLRRLAPVAPVVGLLGAWCEGETRTGTPWPGVVRVYWHQWLPRCAQELGRFRDGLLSTWGLPMTAGEEERLLALAEQSRPRREGLIAICAGRFDMQDWLSAACTKRGYSTEWLRPDRADRLEGVKAAIFDATECSGGELEGLKRLGVALGPAPIIALLDFPRTEDRDRTLAAGASAVLSKPFLLEDLFWELDRVIAGTTRRVGETHPTD